MPAVCTYICTYSILKHAFGENRPPIVMLNVFQHEEQPSLVILKHPVAILVKQPVVMLNLFQHNEQPSLVILKQVQDDELGGGGGGG